MNTAPMRKNTRLATNTAVDTGTWRRTKYHITEAPLKPAMPTMPAPCMVMIT